MKKITALFAAIVFIVTIYVNYLSTAIPLGGYSPGELSDMYPNLFVPAGLTFSIWGVIYILLAMYTVYSLVAVFSKKEIEKHPEAVTAVGKSIWLFIATGLANIGWIFAWQYRRVALSAGIMLVFLIILATMYIILKTGRVKGNVTLNLFVRIPFSVYLGWISVATIANITALLVDSGWKGFGLSPVFWAIALIAIAAALAGYMLLSRGDVAYALVIAWALAGIVLKRLTVDANPVLPVAIAAGTGVALVFLTVVFRLVKPLAYRQE